MPVSQDDSLRARRRWRAMVSFAVLLASLSILMNAWLFKLNADRGAENRAAIERIDREGKDRRSQACLRDEREFARQIRGLTVTYRFLLELSPKQLARVKRTKRGLAGTIYRELGQTEARVKAARPAAFCNERGIGVPGPAPVIPPRPEALR